MNKEYKLKNYGFIQPEIKKEEYLFGSALELKSINESGQYDDCLPVYEPQAEKYETGGCTDWGGQNQIEIYCKKVFGFEPNFAEIYNYILAGITLAGANPHNTYESFRNDGLIKNELLPMPDTYEEFINPAQITPEIKAEAKKWLEKYDYKHEWVTDTSQKNIKEALKYSPVAVAVTAWIEQDGLYVDNGLPNGHWCVCYGYIEDERGIILKIFDSYDHSQKLLHPDHKISVAKRILIKKKDTFYPETETNWLTGLVVSLFRFFKAIFGL